VVLHTLYPVALLLEVFRIHTEGGPAWRAWLVAWVTAQALRAWCMRSLGVFWNARIQVVPGARPLRRGPYRFIPHPNYLAVAVEFVAGPMMFGAWRTAVAFSLLNLVAMAVRIPEEERALKWAAQQPTDP
jgi:methyltransferase